MVALTVAECSRPMSTQVLQDVAVVSMQVPAARPIITAANTGCFDKTRGDDETRRQRVAHDPGDAPARR